MVDEKEIELIRLRKELSELRFEHDKIIQNRNNFENSQAVFLRNLSQNIRIPMNGVMGMLDVLRMTKLDTDQKDYVDLVANYSDNLLSIINDILDYSNLMNDSISIDPAYFELDNLIAEIKDLLHFKIEGKGLKFIVNIDDQIPGFLYGDKNRIKQILVNLLNNAIQHTREGEIRLSIKQLEFKEKKSVLEFKVGDTGFGMDTQLIRKLKEELQVEGLTANFPMDNLGLGLSITQSLLRLMKSHISFKSMHEQGSDFWFILSLPARHKNRSGKFNKDKPHHSASKILLVEDNMLNQKFAKVTLTQKGHYLDIAENGKIALEKFKSEDYDLILMDIQMPIMNGIEATKEIRKFETENQLEPIKIIAVTAFALDNKREECMEAGMNDFLAKPFKPNHLIKMIDEITLL